MSYIPDETSPKFSAMIQELQDLYEQYQKNDTVRIEYLTDVFWDKI